MADTNDSPQTAAEKLLRNPTRSYRPAAAWNYWGVAAAGLDGKPWFSWFDIPRMVRDPRVRFLERMWRSPFQRVQFKFHADDRRVQRYVAQTLRRFWVNSLPWHLSRYFRFGFSAGGAEFYPLKGRVMLDQVRGVEPQDAKPLVWSHGDRKGQAAGFSAPSVGRILMPHAFWFAGAAEISPFFDVPPIAGMFEPWVEKRGRNGAVDSRRRWFRKNATSGGVMRHPGGQSNYGSDENPDWRDDQDVAREMLDATEDGATLSLIHDKHPGDPTKYAWDYEPPSSRADVAGLREYPKDLDSEMNQGVGIPDEVFDAAEVGSGWSGRAVPLMAWLSSADETVAHILKAFYPVLRYAVNANYGPTAWFEVEPLSLVDQSQRQGKGAEGEGGEQPADDDDDGPKKPKKPAGGWEPYKRRDGGRGMRNRQTHQYRTLSDGRGLVSKATRRKVKRLLAARDLSDGRAGGQHAPKGGVTIGGTTYPGGRFIPGAVIDQATPAEKAALAGNGAGGSRPEKLPAKAVALAGKVLAKGAAAAGKAEHVLKDAVLAAHAKLPAGLRGVVGACFRLSMAGFDAGQAAAAAAALDRGVAPEHVAKIGHLLAIADVALFKGTKAMALLGIPGGKAAFAIAGSLPVASLCYLGFSAAASPVKTAKAALAAVKTALKETGGKSWADAKSVPSDFATSVKNLARRAGIGNPALALSDGRGDGEGLEDLMAELADADAARADWLTACFAAAIAETNGDQDAAATLAVQAAGNGRSLSDGRGTAAAEFGPTHAGLCVRAADTGRVLMLQRAATPGDPAAGMWEFPGGRIEARESPLLAACREWTEEVGTHLPLGGYAGDWLSGSGVYAGHVWEVPAEAAVKLDGRAGDQGEAVAWRDPADLGGPDIRAELRADAAKVRAALGAPSPARDLSDGRGGARHAPKGGVTIGGVDYPGGSFIPAEVVESATPAERAALDGGEKSKPPTPTADEPTWRSHPATDRVTKAIAESPGLSDEQRTSYGAAAARILGRMPPKALDRLYDHVTSITFHPTNEAVGEALAAAYENNPAAAAFVARVRQMVADGLAPGGAYSTQTGEVHADGGFPADSAGGMVSKSLPEATPAHIYAHEWAHAIDGPGFEYSRRPAWSEAFMEEFQGGRLTAYASTKPSEAWAEFARAVYAADVPLDRVEAAFPKASAYWKECGLWPV